MLNEGGTGRPSMGSSKRHRDRRCRFPYDINSPSSSTEPQWTQTILPDTIKTFLMDWNDPHTAMSLLRQWQACPQNIDCSSESSPSESQIALKNGASYSELSAATTSSSPAILHLNQFDLIASPGKRESHETELNISLMSEHSFVDLDVISGCWETVMKNEANAETMDWFSYEDEDWFVIGHAAKEIGWIE
ncbi:hypothetical protein BCR33DRAFT_717468 [Rhizoclosmatium globosum]|uniref:Uncharacterized protein n=1 Tax=Rhizoclosmatium globosum TaxID=329046 RepID=A0A1Y2C9X2_9FUNG|nr:hypothetical protein BCR33DRAFT_717468 [Rhizoclosmatium globosum]|eukprot:ORY43833.1 hypothetical protein BCR33DRAFT_717468 [Rhizoclosmatium globosum]